MGEGSDRDEGHAGFGVGAQGFAGDSAAGLGFFAAGDAFHRSPALCRREVVEHNARDGVEAKCFFDVGQGAAFDFNGEVEPAVGQVGLGAAHGVRDSAREVDVVVFEHHHIVQTLSVVAGASGTNGIFFQVAPTGCGLSGVQKPNAGIRNQLAPTVC